MIFFSMKKKKSFLHHKYYLGTTLNTSCMFIIYYSKRIRGKGMNSVFPVIVLCNNIVTTITELQS